LKSTWDALLRIVGGYKGQGALFFCVNLLQSITLYLIPNKPNNEIVILLFAMIVSITSMSSVLLLLISDKGVEDENIILMRLLSSYKDPELLQIGKTSVWKRWRETSFLLLAPWTSALVSSKFLINYMHVLFIYFRWLCVAGLLASVLYFFINHVRISRFMS
jgi:hypothetical protein